MSFKITKKDIAERAAHPPIASWYNNYLLSHEWHLKKEAVQERANGKCERCRVGKSKIKYVVHHITYERVTMERLEDLLYLCSKCHNIIHHSHRIPFIGRIYNESYGTRLNLG